MSKLTGLAVMSAIVINAHVAGAGSLKFLDFNDQSPGTVITNQYVSSGVRFDLLGTSVPAGPTIFEVPVPANAFNVSGGNLVPGVKTFDAQQFDLLMSFTQRIDFLSIYALDAEEPFSLKAFLKGDLVAEATPVIVGSLEAPTQGPVAFALIGAIGGELVFDQVLIDLTNGDGSIGGGPENYDNLTFHRVPEPGTLSIFAVGLLFLCLMTRHRALWERSSAGSDAWRSRSCSMTYVRSNTPLARERQSFAVS